MIQALMGNVSQVYGLSNQKTTVLPVLNIYTWLKIVLNILATSAVLAAILRWFVGFYFAIRFDTMHKKGSLFDDEIEFGSSCVQLWFFGLVSLLLF